MAGYVTTVLGFVCNELRARKASSVCGFWKLPHFLIQQNSVVVFLDMFNKEFYSLSLSNNNLSEKFLLN